MFLKERDTSKLGWRIGTSLGKNNKSMMFLVYFWFVYLKPFLTFILGLLFSCLSIIILYAEIANFFDAKDNIIYNIITAPQLSSSSSYFFAHVRHS